MRRRWVLILGWAMVTAASLTKLYCAPGSTTDRPPQFAVDSGGRRIAIEINTDAEHSAIAIIDIKSKRTERIVRIAGRSCAFPCFVKDRLFFSVYPGSNIGPSRRLGAKLYALDGEAYEPLPTGNGKNLDRPLCGSEKTLFFARARLFRPYSFGGHVWDHYDIYSLDLATGKERRLTRAEYNDIYGGAFVSHRVYFSAEPGSLLSLDPNAKKPSPTLVRGRIGYLAQAGRDGMVYATEKQAIIFNPASRIERAVFSYGQGHWQLSADDRSRVFYIRSSGVGKFDVRTRAAPYKDEEVLIPADLLAGLSGQ